MYNCHGTDFFLQNTTAANLSWELIDEKYLDVPSLRRQFFVATRTIEGESLSNTEAVVGETYVDHRQIERIIVGRACRGLLF